MSAQMIQAIFENGKMKASTGQRAVLSGRMNWREFVQMLDALAAARMAQQGK